MESAGGHRAAPVTTNAERILGYLADYPGAGSGEIARSLDLTLPIVCGALSFYIKRGMVRRVQNGPKLSYYLVQGEPQPARPIQNPVLYTLIGLRRELKDINAAIALMERIKKNRML